MKTYILWLIVYFALPQFGLAQINGAYINLPIPNDLKAKETGAIKIQDQTFLYNGYHFVFKIHYNPNSTNESIYQIEFSSSNSELNEKIKKIIHSDLFEYSSISNCYSGEKQILNDWFILTECTLLTIDKYLK